MGAVSLGLLPNSASSPVAQEASLAATAFSSLSGFYPIFKANSRVVSAAQGFPVNYRIAQIIRSQ